jgi:hypothetical protein
VLPVLDMLQVLVILLGPEIWVLFEFDFVDIEHIVVVRGMEQKRMSSYVGGPRGKASLQLFNKPGR